MQNDYRHKTTRRHERFTLLLATAVALWLLGAVACQTWPGAIRPIPPPLVLEAPPPAAYAALTAVTTGPGAADIPERDMVALLAGFQGRPVARALPDGPASYRVGDVETFWVKDYNAGVNKQVAATLVYRSAALNLWLAAGQRVAPEVVEAAARRLETEILPTTRAFFGAEPQPGVDGDLRINILHLEAMGGIAVAAYSAADEYITAVNPYSNQRKMIYVSLDQAKIGGAAYFTAIAHELQHLLQWRLDKNEETWLNEGFAELAAYVNGLPVERGPDYAANPDVQLTRLSQAPDVVGAHYAASFLFVTYFYDRFGAEATRALARHPANGRSSFDAVLEEYGAGLTFDDLFADWLVANYLTGQGLGSGVHQYQALTLPPLQTTRHRRLPATGQATVQQYGADLIEIRGDAPVTAVFTGTQQVNLVNTRPHSGDAFWLSLPADEASLTLTRAFDLTELETATLTFWTWYDLEEGWDYGYLAVSDDDGRSWDLLTTAASTRANPQGNSFGPGYTGASGGGETAVWIQQTADLTPYAGREILARFLVVTDDAVTAQGLAIDDVALPELGYLADFESGPDGWEGAGFALTGTVLPQRFVAQAVLLGRAGVRVERLPLDESQRGEWRLPLGSDYNRAVLIIAGVTPVTDQAAVYAYTIRTEANGK